MTESFPICVQPMEDRACHNDELFDSTGWWGKKMGRKSLAKTEQEAIEKYRILEPTDLTPVVANFENEQWHITKKFSAYGEEKEQTPDVLNAYPICNVLESSGQCDDIGTTGKLSKFWNPNKKSFAKTKKEAIEKVKKANNVSEDIYDAVLLNGKWHVSRKDIVNRELHKTAARIPGNHEKQTEYYECLRRLNDNPDIPKPTRDAICKIVTDVYNENNGVQTAVGFSKADIEKEDKEDINELLHIWFNDTTVVHDIYKTLSQSGIFCFFNEIVFRFDETVTKLVETNAENEIWPVSIVDRIDVHGNPRLIPLTPYVYTSSIMKCYEKTIAIPLDFQFKEMSVGHANMLIINRRIIEDKLTFVIEHFEPHGEHYMEINKSNVINNEIDKVIMSLFDSKTFEKAFEYLESFEKNGKKINKTLANDKQRLITKNFDIQIIHPLILCPRSLEMQSLVSGTQWAGTCFIFSLWYAVIRLLYPSKKSEDIYEYIHRFLMRGTPHEILKQITRTFTKLITLDINTGIVTNFNQEKKHIHPITETKIRNEKLRLEMEKKNIVEREKALEQIANFGREIANMETEIQKFTGSYCQSQMLEYITNWKNYFINNEHPEKQQQKTAWIVYFNKTISVYLANFKKCLEERKEENKFLLKITDSFFKECEPYRRYPEEKPPYSLILTIAQSGVNFVQAYVEYVKTKDKSLGTKEEVVEGGRSRRKRITKKCPKIKQNIKIKTKTNYCRSIKYTKRRRRKT
jgi:hypothetical protein